MGDIIRYFQDMSGRNRRLEPVEFPEDEIIVSAPDFKVNPLIESTFINLPPAVFGVITASEGSRLVIPQGGIKDLAGGVYQLHYIDQRERTKLLSEISSTTSDGFAITLRVLVTYRVQDPERILEVVSPVQTLFTTLETAIKNYIISHTHDEIVKPQETDDALDERALENYIIKQLGQHRACSGFVISNLTIQEWVGDKATMNLRKDHQIIEKETLNKQKRLQLEQNVAYEERELERRKGEIEQTKAQSEVEKQKILHTAQQLKIELDKMRTLPQRRHEEIMKVVEALKEMPGFPRNPSEAKILQDLTSALIEKTEDTTHQQMPVNGKSNGYQVQEQKVSDLANTILNLVKPKKR